ncbi:MAG: hypothetical protein WDN31_14635 [Hyphomicrobium sp.]
MYRFSTDDVPKQDRFEVYRDKVVRKLFHWDVSRATREDCHFGVRVGASLGPVQNAVCDATPFSFRRGEKQLSGGSDGFMLVVNRSGSYEVSQGKRDAALDVGAATPDRPQPPSLDHGSGDGHMLGDIHRQGSPRSAARAAGNSAGKVHLRCRPPRLGCS